MSTAETDVMGTIMLVRLRLIGDVVYDAVRPECGRRYPAARMVYVVNWPARSGEATRS